MLEMGLDLCKVKCLKAVSTFFRCMFGRKGVLKPHLDICIQCLGLFSSETAAILLKAWTNEQISDVKPVCSITAKELYVVLFLKSDSRRCSVQKNDR